MARDVSQASQLARLDESHTRLLLDPARPIVLAPCRQRLEHIAPHTDELGIMLPYAPLHEMLFQFGAPAPLVLTSANRSSEPIAYEDTDALDRLTGIADVFLIGERPIARRVDDSVVAVRRAKPVMVRRARGYAPRVVAHLPSRRPILALGADLKNSVAVVVDGEVIVSQHIGDLGDLETDRACIRTIRDLMSMYKIDPSHLTVVHDAHPEYVSTALAMSLPAASHVAVQHHRAHIASVLAEQADLEKTVIGVSMDGTGYGDDGSIWGGEFFVGGLRDGLTRVMHLRSFVLPGGDAAARFPVQAAAGLLAELQTPDLTQAPFLFPERFIQASRLVEKNVRCFESTSAGRLFDAVAALCGFTREIAFEGQAAAWLEDQAHQAGDRCGQQTYPFGKFDHGPLLGAIINERQAGRDVREIATIFHRTVAHEIYRTIERLADQYSTRDVVLSGGVFQNRLLLEFLEQASQASELDFMLNESVPCNDGGISLGQAAIASMVIEQQGSR